MTIEEAIKELSYLRDGYIQLRWIAETQAANLGIEALKRDVYNRRINNHPDQALLPGETDS